MDCVNQRLDVIKNDQLDLKSLRTPTNVQSNDDWIEIFRSNFKLIHRTDQER